MTLLFWLLVGHAVCDYPLQGDFLARAKNPFNPIPGVPWYQALFWHALMHAGAVMLITHAWRFAVVEFCLHCVMDVMKCGYLGKKQAMAFNVDQGFHVGCKLLYAAVLTLI